MREATSTMLGMQWQPLEVSFEGAREYDNPYMDVQMWVDFTSPRGKRSASTAFGMGGVAGVCRLPLQHQVCGDGLAALRSVVTAA